MTLSLRRIFMSSLMVWVLVSALGVYFLIHLHKFINFGIDLVGGTYITLEVQLDKAVENETIERMQAAINLLKKENKVTPETQKLVGRDAVITFKDDADASVAEQLFATHDVHLGIRKEGASLVMSLPSEEVTTIHRDAVEGNMTVLRKRLDPLGAGEITIAAHGDKHIIVELPNVHNPAQAKAMIGKAALLEVKKVEDMGSSEQELIEKYGGTLPEGTMIVAGKEGSRKMYYLVPSFTDITGRLLKDASMGFGGTTGAEPVVEFVFKPEGGEKFYELTSQNIGEAVAILIDGVVITAPRVNTAISSHGQITGSFTPAQAQDLALMLKSGAFVAPVTFEEERHIGPSLGEASIRQGLLACIVGMALLFLFSVIVYKVAGLFAFIVLLYNLLLILFALAWLGATLTLPGIAGMILTIGMAIDASILIYERIREELAAGASMRHAVDIGFKGAMSVILDANITHFLVALVLYKLGVGPIKGFAATMIVGIVATLLTGLLLLKSIFNFVLINLGVQKIKI